MRNQAIYGWGVYLPHWRLDRSTIGQVTSKPSGRGTRAVAAYDEDATTMAVAASRRALADGRRPPASLWLATVAPPYADKTNATAVHAALRLDRATPAYDAVGSVRSALGALRAGLAQSEPALVVASDVRIGLPGGAEELIVGDGAVALLVGPADAAPPLAEVRAWASLTEEFLDRWRQPGEATSKVWEERFGETRYVPLAVEAWESALKQADLTAADVDVVAVVGLHERAAASAARKLGMTNPEVVAELGATVGNTGAAHPALVLAALLEQAAPGQRIGLIVLADGVDAIIVETTEALGDYRPTLPVRDQLVGADLPYGTFLAWRGLLPLEPPRRPEPARPSASAAGRNTDWKFGFVASERDDGSIHLPPSAFDHQVRPMADALGTIATYTVDHLAYSPAPPVVFAIVDFDGGGRLPVELTDVRPDDVAIGGRVEMTFRRLFSVDGIHNYFWKARPL